MSNYISFSRKRANQLRQAIKSLEKQRAELTVHLRYLNSNYQFGSIDYTQYSKQYARYLGHRSIENWEAEHARNLSRYAQELNKLERRISRNKNEDTSNRLQIAITASFVVLLASAFGLMVTFGGSNISGAVISAESVIPSNATVQIYFAVAASENVSNGIEFGTLLAGSANNNATDNYNVDATNSSLYLILSGDSNVNIDFCLAANTDLKNGTSQIIPLSNLKFANATTTEINTPSLSAATSLTTSYQVNNQNILPGGKEYYRFWLNLPSDTPALTYNNTIRFGAVQTGSTCPG